MLRKCYHLLRLRSLGMFSSPPLSIFHSPTLYLRPGFYTTFWQLTSYDLGVPMERYQEESTNLKNLSQQEDRLSYALDRSPDKKKRPAAHAHKMRRDRYLAFVDALAKESKDQVNSRTVTVKRIAKEKANWFTHPGALLQSLV